MKTVFLTGSNGYIGKHLLTRLLNQNVYKVIALSRRTENNIQHKNLKWLNSCLSETSKITHWIEKVDTIIHTAMGYDQDGNELKEVEKQAVETFLSSGKRIVYTGNLFSTTTDKNQIIDELPDLNPQANYRNKLEHLILKSSNKNAVIRLGCVYGGKGSYINDLFPQNQQGDFLYNSDYNYGQWPLVSVSEVVDLFMNVLNKELNGIYHASTDSSIAVDTIIKKLALSNNKKIVNTDLDKLNQFKFNHQKQNITALNKNSVNSGWKINDSNF